IMSTDRPNIVLVFADQMRGSAMGCAGNPDVITPVMDQLAQDGVFFENGIATTPVCCPNRGTMLTSTYPICHNVPVNDMPVRTDLPSLGTIAKDNGYDTAYIGKWHLDGSPRTKFTPPGPRRLGFDYWAVYNCTHAYMDPKYYRDSPEVIREEGYEPEIQTNIALDYLESRREKNTPFCMVVSWGPPHDPYDQVPQKYQDMYDPQKITLQPNVQVDAENPLVGNKDCRTTIAQYYAAVTALDEQLGRIIQKLKETGEYDNTLFIYTSDHGDMLWSHGMMKKQAPWAESVDIPLLMRMPTKLGSGAKNDVLFGTVDLLPTICGLLEWEKPATFQGLDLSTYLTDADATQPESALIANYHGYSEAHHQKLYAWRGIRTKTHSYIEKPNREPWMLFDNQNDPYQMNNLIGDSNAKDLQATLYDALTVWLERTDDPALPDDELLKHMGLFELWEYHRDIVRNEWRNPVHPPLTESVKN
ncbi:MAG: sulfatase, partial [Phycisphaeraceae bacterium JB051]